VNVTTKSYGINWTESYGNELYARGHQIPNADRNKESNWQDQTFLVTNSTPQIQNKFNASIWGSLEEAVRNAARATDTVYVATGPVFRTVGGSETIQYIHPQLDPNKNVPVPNYYWKALLKVKRSGNTVTDAYAIGFWYEHKSYVNGESYDDDEFVVSIDDIERWTGLDLFTNLPGTNSTGTEKTAEEKDNWNAFCRF
jgi:endonuclease G